MGIKDKWNTYLAFRGRSKVIFYLISGLLAWSGILSLLAKALMRGENIQAAGGVILLIFVGVLVISNSTVGNLSPSDNANIQNMKTISLFITLLIPALLAGFAVFIFL